MSPQHPDRESTRIMARLPVLACFAATLALTLPDVASAQSDSAAQSLIDRLKPSGGSGTRGIRMPGEAPAAPASVAAPAPVWSAPARPPVPVQEQTATARPPALRPAPRETTADAPSVSITVTFPTGSATLTPEAERSLDELGRALASPDLAPYRFRIEGHTDTVGSPESNQALSERRAFAVRDYLTSRHGVSAARLESIGLGESQPLVATPDESAEARNRRVQIINLGS